MRTRLVKRKRRSTKLSSMCMRASIWVCRKRDASSRSKEINFEWTMKQREMVYWDSKKLRGSKSGRRNNKSKMSRTSTYSNSQCRNKSEDSNSLSWNNKIKFTKKSIQLNSKDRKSQGKPTLITCKSISSKTIWTQKIYQITWVIPTSLL